MFSDQVIFANGPVSSKDVIIFVYHLQYPYNSESQLASLPFFKVEKNHALLSLHYEFFFRKREMFPDFPCICFPINVGMTKIDKCKFDEKDV